MCFRHFIFTLKRRAIIMNRIRINNLLSSRSMYSLLRSREVVNYPNGSVDSLNSVATLKNRKVYGSLNSVATLKVLACLFEHDLDFDFVPIDLEAGEHKKKPFLSMNPFGQVPVYEDGDAKQFESRAIIRSMAHQYGKKGEELIYWDSREQAVVANWIDVEDHHFEPPALKLISELVIKPKKRLTPDEETVAEAEAKLAKVLDVYEARLSKFKYLASDKYTIADMLHLPNIQALMGTQAKRLFDSRPRLSAWCTAILARSAWIKVVEMQQKAQA